MRIVKMAALVSGSLVLSIAWLCGQDGPPKAPVRDITNTYFGQAIVDPYRWMEDANVREGYTSAERVLIDPDRLSGHLCVSVPAARIAIKRRECDRSGQCDRLCGAHTHNLTRTRGQTTLAMTL
jgi:hypothetical protein